MTQMSTTTLEGGEKILGDETIGSLAERLRGRLLLDRDPEYEEARRIYNAMVDKRPAMIARCADEADVAAAVAFARDNDLLVAVRSGGHSGPGLGTCDGGLVVDLSPQKGIRVDPDARTVRVQAGCTWGDVDHATHAFGLATVSGVISTTGVGGLALGGGHGYLTRKYGLTIDNLLEADVVLADGSLVRASAQENPDLFWALRGGGGNFGVVTSFLFRLHPVSIVQCGPTMWSLDDAEVVMKAYRELLPQAPEDLYAFLAFMKVPPVPPFPDELHHRTVCAIVWCHLGTEKEAARDMAPLRSVATPLFEHIGPAPYPALQSMNDPLYPKGLQWYWKGDFVREIDDEAIALHLQHASQLPTPLSTMHLYPIDRAVHRVGPRETAFNFRDATWSQVIVGVDADGSRSREITEWARDYWSDLHPHSAGGAYVNFLMGEGEERIRATYGDNYDRLVEVKRRYDPGNLFRVNQNIPPR